MVVRKSFPDKYKKIKNEMPAEYPFINVINRIKADNANAESNHFICKQLTDTRVKQNEDLRRKLRVRAVCDALHMKRYKLKMESDDKTQSSRRKWSERPSRDMPMAIPQKPSDVIVTSRFQQTAGITAVQQQSTFWYYDKKLPFHPDTLDIVPVVDTFRFDLFPSKIILRAE